MWFVNTLWEIIVSWFVLAVVKFAYGALRLIWWLFRATPRTRAYVALSLYTMVQKAMIWMLEEGVVTSAKGRARIRRFDKFMHPWVDATMRRGLATLDQPTPGT